MTWTSAIKVIKTGIDREQTAGTAETAPSEYCYLTNEGIINVPREYDELRAQGSRSLTFTVGKPYHSTATFGSWIFPEDNGFGPCLYGAFGNASAAKHGTASYMHTFTMADTQIPSFTVWAKTGVYEAKAANMQVNRLTINNAKASVADFTAEFVGSDLITCSDFGTESYVSSSTKVFRSGNATLIYDDTEITSVDDVNIVIDNGIDPNEAKSFGVDYAQHILAGTRSLTGSMTVFVEDTTILEDYWGGSTGPALNQATLPIEFLWESSNIETNIATSTAVKRSGSGTPTLTPGGDFDDDPATGFFEVKITTAGAADKFKWRKNYGAWSEEVVVDGTAQALADSVTAKFSATTGCTTADRWFFYVGDIPYSFRLELPAVKIQSFDQQSTGNRLSAKVNFAAEMSGTYGYDAKAWICNTESTAYNAV